jgi:hypothetical protein
MLGSATSRAMPKPSVATLLTAGALVFVLVGARARTATYRPAPVSAR